MVQLGVLLAHLLDRLLGLVFEVRLAAIDMVKATRDLARQLDVHHLVLAYRHQAGPINQNVSRLQQRIAEEAVGREVLFLQSFLLILVGRHPLQPTERGDHRQKEV